MIRTATADDAVQICQIYNHYVQNTYSTFESTPVQTLEMENRIKEITTDLPWLVKIQNDEIVGYAYASAWKSRCAYRFSAETTIYLLPEFSKKGLGTLLYEALIVSLQLKDMHSVLGAIAMPNLSSVRLHEKLGFEKVGRFKEVGRKFDKWIDVEYWELLLDEPGRETTIDFGQRECK